MRVLLTNDDGIHAGGLAALERIARTLTDDVRVVAPEVDQSGFAHSLSLSEPLRLRKPDDRHFALRGTPTDCVIMGVRHLLPEPPDLVLSGVNSGSNVADDVSYSGAFEGTMLGILSVAMSQAYDYSADERVVPYRTAEALAPALLRNILVGRPDPGILVNVNFPRCAPEAVAGTAVTVQGRLAHGLAVDARRDGRGMPHFWLCFQRERQGFAPGSDIHTVANGFLSVTPLQLDMTAHAARERMAEALA